MPRHNTIRNGTHTDSVLHAVDPKSALGSSTERAEAEERAIVRQELEEVLKAIDRKRRRRRRQGS